MDPFFLAAAAPTTFDDDDDQQALLLADYALEFEAQQLLQQIGWTYYTIWKQVIIPDPNYNMFLNVQPTDLPGLAWRRGDVNRLFTATEVEHGQKRACKMALVLQQFYQQCRFLPLGMGIAGEAAASSRQHRWALGNGLILQQINALSKFNHQPAPPDLMQGQYGFQTIVCIPLQKGGGVLEIGTTEMVPESDGVLSLVLNFTKGLAIGRGGPAASQSLNIVRQLYHGKADHQQHVTAGDIAVSNAMQIYGSRGGRQASLSSSYLSSSNSSATNFSSPSPEQMANTSSMALSPSPNAHNSFISNEEMLMSPAMSVQAITPVDMVTNQIGHIDMQYGISAVSMPLSFMSAYELYNLCGDPAPSLHNNNQFPLSDCPPLCFSSVNADATSPSLPSLSEYILPQQPNDLVNLDSMIQPIIQGAAHEHNIAASAAEICADHYPTIIRAKGKQEAQQIIEYEVPDEKSRSDDGIKMQGLTGNYGNRLRHEEINQRNEMTNQNANIIAGVIKDPSESGLFGAFRPWSRLNSSRLMKKQKGIAATTSNRYNLKQIMTFHLPRIADCMIKEKAEAARAGNYALMRSGSVNPGSQDLNIMSVSTTTSTSEQNKSELAAAKHHMFAERKRRQKQGDCLHLLRTLVPSISKRDKLTTLKRTIEYVKEMQSLVRDLQQQNSSLKRTNDKQDPQQLYVMGRSSYSLQDNECGPLESLLATCDFHPSPNDTSPHVLPHFQLELTINLKEAEVNSSIIRIINALHQRKLHCIDVKLEFHQSTKNLCAKILAHYKDEDKFTPNLEDIQAIKQWWTNYVGIITT